MIRNTSYIIFFLLLFIMLAFERFIIGEITFALKTAFLLFFLIFEILNYKKTDPENWLINPVVLASVFTFAFSYGITNIIFFLPQEITSNSLYNKLGPEPFNIMSNAMTSIIFGAVAMWLGFKSNWGNKLFRLMTIRLIDVRKFLRVSFSINYYIIYIIIIVGVISRLYAINIGIYGYSQSSEKVAESINIAQYLNYLGIWTKLALFAVSLSYYAKSEKKLLYLLIFIILIELYFGLLSGLKSQLAFPIIIPFFSYLIIKKKINKSLMTASIVLVFIAFLVIEPFRILRHRDRAFNSDPAYIINTMVDAYNMNQSRGLVEQWSNEPIYISIIKRNNYVMDASKAIEYDENIGLTKKDPDFINKLITIPFQAFIPRAIWASKERANIGGWFTRTVWGYNLYSSTAMSPFGFLYFAGGISFIIIFFFIFGIMQKALFQFIGLGSGGILIFVGLLGTVIIIDSAVNSIFVSWLRNYPFLLFSQYFIFRR